MRAENQCAGESGEGGRGVPWVAKEQMLKLAREGGGDGWWVGVLGEGEVDGF